MARWADQNGTPDPDWLAEFAADWGLPHEPRLRRDDTHRSFRYRARLGQDRRR